ncbi:AAA family ATPase [Paenibacillus sp. CC-CFT747]|nr:AAA family ATPase [Paenibacillus sp. CC-CFT747]
MTRTTGLTLGKFAPLHKGHQFMIETALRETDEVIVVIYDSPDVTNVPLSVRAGWIRTLYPQVEVIEAWGGPEETGYTREIEKAHEDYITSLLGGRRITHFYSSEPYGEHMSRALGAVDRRVDPDRKTFPVSGTAVRQAPFENRAFVDPVVYRDLVSSVLLLGAPSTGKTTLAARLAEELGTVWMPEYGREYWDAHQVDRRLTPEQLVEIAEGHLEREERMLGDANWYLFVDTNALTTRMFAQYYHGFVLPRLEELAAKAAVRHDLVFVCGDEIPYDDTWDRSGFGMREEFQRKILADLAVRRIPYVTLTGTVEERVHQAKAVLERQEKYRSLPDRLARELGVTS